MGVSVIICCYNSAQRIKDTLHHLFSQVVNGLQWEIVLVDNASTDNTVETAEKYWKSLNSVIPLRIESEPHPGLSYARATGIQASRYQIIILCDDDNWLTPNYIQTAYELLLKNQTIGALGGHGTIRPEGVLPSWFESYAGYYACIPQGTGVEDVSDTRGYLYGAGLVLRKEAWTAVEKLGMKSILTDRKGSKLSSGGDVELCYQMRLLGWKLYYSESMMFYHFMPKGRLTESYLIRLIGNINYSGVFLRPYNYYFSGIEVTRKTWIEDVVRQIKNTVRAIFFLVFHKFSLNSRIDFVANWNSMISLITQFNSYSSNFLLLKKALAGYE